MKTDTRKDTSKNKKAPNGAFLKTFDGTTLLWFFEGPGSHLSSELTRKSGLFTVFHRIGTLGFHGFGRLGCSGFFYGFRTLGSRISVCSLDVGRLVSFIGSGLFVLFWFFSKDICFQRNIGHGTGFIHIGLLIQRWKFYPAVGTFFGE